MTRRPHVELTRGRVGPDGRRLCCFCGDPIPKGRRDWCGDQCVLRYGIASGDHGLIRSELWRRDKGVCALCGSQCACNVRDRMWTPDGWVKSTEIPWDADHIVPLVEGGGHSLDNLRTLCHPCHKRVTRELRARLAAAKRSQKVSR